jgi:hypothetical protein
MSHIQKGESKKEAVIDTRLVSRARRSEGVFTKGSEPLLSSGLLVAAARMIESSLHFFFGYISGSLAPLTEFPL